MTRHERLVEAYEDAYFDLLMEEVAEMEGAEWEARLKELENDPEAAVPEEIDRKCIQTIQRCFAKKKREEGLRIAGKVLNRVAVFLAIISMMFTTVLAVSEDARVAAANLLITVNERYTEMHMASDEINSKRVLDGNYFSRIHVGWLPEDFSYFSGSPDSRLTLTNSDNLSVVISCTDGDATLQVDTENADTVGYIEINGFQVLRVSKDGYTHLVLINEEKALFVSVFVSEGIDSEVAYKIMENISFY